MNVNAAIAKTVLGFGLIYRVEIQHELIVIWQEILRDLTLDELVRAVKIYNLDPELSKFMPRPGQIYGLAKPEPDKREEASLIADSIWTALTMYGEDKYNTNRAKLKIGPVGWEWIETQGGWSTFHRNYNQEDVNMGTTKAQIRNSVMGLIENGKRNRSTGSLENLSECMKTIT